MSIVCNSPKFEVPNDQSSYFNIHMPGSFMPTSSDASSGYFDLNPNSTPAQTPYFDALKQQSPTQTPFYECEPLQTPFFEQIPNQHGRNVSIALNSINTPSNNSDAQFSPLMTPGYPSFRKFQDGWAANNSFVPKLPPVRRQTTKASSNKKPISLPAGKPFTPISCPLEEYSIDNVADMINLKLSSEASIGFLKGGFMTFSEKHADLCEKTIKNGSLPSSAKNPRTIHNKFGPFTCPTPIIEYAGVNPFFSNIRQNLELSCGITETIPVRVPDNADLSKLPGFMRDVLGESGEMKLAEIFQEIERAEQRRLQSLMLLHGNQSTPDCPFSISAGIEKGSKNRYNNIWPYDHARVKINECNEGDCDYVNASFVQAAGCNKRYIATQGPLPATCTDFWKVVWEQNSRVIVMLTKEQEAGRVLCHRYWTEHMAPCNFGSLELTFISETSPISNSSGSIDSIVIRKFSLAHKNHPEIPAREITQLHFLGWPDYGIPDSPCHILNLIETANGTQHDASMQCESSREIGPMIVHCSAGCGRTGAFCTIDSVLTMLNTGNLDTNKDVIQATISQFREQRLSMVQTLRQFVFCYEAVLFKVAGAI
ncbi:Tyrosine-protein phosphatase 2/3 [Gigaspora margarita]|uniref:Tyrosine-protein phosphatase 2/3 n=1 Tax=Gigaspora margarita TaxID=4874 RepID=A0A8H3X0Y1_GIGMA|nr:Tyrosine-protein phosphatase 2/3 [Gigaspora margarita]